MPSPRWSLPFTGSGSAVRGRYDISVTASGGSVRNEGADLLWDTDLYFLWERDGKQFDEDTWDVPYISQCRAFVRNIHSCFMLESG